MSLDIARHGTRTSAQVCDCARCQAARKKANRTLPPLHPLDPRHGTCVGYDRHGCRCDKCKTARREADRARRARRAA